MTARVLAVVLAAVVFAGTGAAWAVCEPPATEEVQAR